MANLQWLLDLLLAGLLMATLFHAMRLERALGVLKSDRGALDEMLSNFNASTRDAEAGIDRLRQLTEGAGRQVVRQSELGAALKDDLAFLIERGDRLADRMDALIRSARPLAAEPLRSGPDSERGYDIRELAGGAGPRMPEPRIAARPASGRGAEPPPLQNAEAGRREAAPEAARVRSQAERDLLNALRTTK